MRRFIILMSAPDAVDLKLFGDDLNALLKKHGCMGMLDEVINPLLIRNDDTIKPGYG